MIRVGQERGESKAARAQVAKWENADTDEVLPQQVTYYDLSAHHVHWDRVTWGALAIGAMAFWAWGQHHNTQLLRARVAELAAANNGASITEHPETVALAALPMSLAPGKRLSVNFSEPAPEANVAATLTVRGTVQGVPEGKHLWLVTRRDPRLGFWPKERIAPDAEGRFEQTTWDFGADGRMSICVVSTTPVDTARFEEWLAVGDREDEWPSVLPSASSNVVGCQDVTLAKHRLE